MFSLPQEIEVWYIIPAIRSELARILTKDHHMTFEKVGNIIGVSKAAVCQYINKKRANTFAIPQDIKKEMKKSAEILSKNNNLAVQEIIRILNLIKKSGSSCLLCEKYNKGVLKQCGRIPVKGE